MKLLRAVSLSLAVAGLFTLSCAKPEAEEAVPVSGVPGEETESASHGVFVPGVFEVYLDDDMVQLVEEDLANGNVPTKSAPLTAFFEEMGVTGMERIFPDAGEFEPRHREFGLHKWYWVYFDQNAAVRTKAEGMLHDIPGILNVNPVHRLVTADNVFNDPLLSRQWHYDNKGTTWADVNIVPVWKNYTTGSSDVIVSVIDGGIDPTHEDLVENFIPGGENGSKNFMTGNTGYRIVAHDHGTHVAGTISAVNNNGKGVAGIAGGDAAKGIKGARLMSCQIFQEGLRGSNSDAAIVWGADHGAVISNNSWGYDFVDDHGNYDKQSAESTHNLFVQPNTGDYKSSFKDAVDYFNKYAGMKGGKQVGPMAGGIVFFAAGNDGRPYGPPGCYPGCMSVGAITNYGTRSNFSNYGDWVDIAAPGVSVMSTIPGNKYGEMSGTSMACPHVTGVAALVISYCGGDGFTRDQLWDKLIGGANSSDLPASYRIGPLVDALGAINYGTGEPPQPVASFTVDKVVSNNVTITLTVPSDANGQPAYGFRVLAAPTQAALDACDPKSPGAGILHGSFLSRDAQVGETVTGTIGDLGFNETYYIAVSAFDYGRNFSQLSPSQTITTKGNHAPKITTDYTGGFSFKVQDSFDIVFNIVDEDEHVLTVEYEKDENDPGALRLLESIRPGEYVLHVAGNLADEGDYHAVLKASDNYGLYAEYPIDYTILPNAAPVVKKAFENIILHYSGEMVTVNTLDYIEDPDGEILAFNIQISDPSVVHVNQPAGTSNINITSLASSGVATVTLKGTDAGRKSAEASFQVLVRPEGTQVQSYPNPVTSTLFVGTGDEASQAEITLFSSTGAVVYDTVATCSAFAPAQIDVKGLAPGRYNLRVRYAGNEYNNVIIKK